MEIKKLISQNYRSNTFIISSGKHCAVVDPGMESGLIIQAIKEMGLSPVFVLLTHGHFDHIFSLDTLKKHFDIPVYIHEDDAEMLTDSNKNAYSFFFADSFRQNKADFTFKDGDRLNINNEDLTVIHTPGHSKGSSCFMCGRDLLTGDTLFENGIGRSDLYGGDAHKLFDSLKALGAIENKDSLKIYPGHGGCSLLSDALDKVLY